MTSWANPGTRDLHLDLREVIRPGARGVRDVLIAALRDAVRSGRLTAGTMLPPSRTLAADLGLARNTVAEAYAELVAEGWLASRQGTGTWVGSTGVGAVASRPRGARGEPRHNLFPGSPDVAEFPRSAWLASARRALTAAPNEALRLGDSRGRPELRSALADYLARVRGVRTSEETIVICAGARHGLELLSRAFAARGGRALAVEAYGLPFFRDAIAGQGLRTIPIGLDDAGATVAELDGLDAAGVLLTPAHHNPHGMPLHPARRTAVVDWARRTGALVLEDDYDGEFRYDRQPVGAVQSLDPDVVAYLGSASKSLAPALRLGWLALPDEWVGPVTEAAGGYPFYTDAIAQLTMADFVTSGHYDRHIRRMRLRYRRRRDTLVTRLAHYDVGIRGLSAGLNLLLTLPDGVEARVLQRAGEAGLGIAGLASMRHPLTDPGVPEPDGVIVGFGTPSDHAFDPAVDALCAVLTASGLAAGP